MKQIFKCCTLYHLLIAYLIIRENDLQDSACIIETMSKRRANLLSAAEGIRKKGCNVEVIIESNQIKRTLLDVMAFNKYKGGINTTTYNFRWNLENVYKDAIVYCKLSNSLVLIEDGQQMVSNTTGDQYTRNVKKMFGFTLQNFLPKTIKIFVSDPSKYTTMLPLEKIEKLECLEAIKNDSKLREEIKDIFSLKMNNSGELQDMSYKSKLRGVVFTQPLSEDGYISENEKIEIYRKIIEFYEQYGTVDLKVHPRDSTDYTMLGCIIFGKEWPSELLDLVGVYYDFAIGICTSAIVSSSAKYKMNLNENYLHDKKLQLIPLKIE